MKFIVFLFGFTSAVFLKEINKITSIIVPATLNSKVDRLQITSKSLHSLSNHQQVLIK